MRTPVLCGFPMLKTLHLRRLSRSLAASLPLDRKRWGTRAPLSPSRNP